MARLIFCFFAEDTRIFHDNLFTRTVEAMTQTDGSDTAEVIGTLFRVMNVKREDRKAGNFPKYALDFPYVNGGLFGEMLPVPSFSRTSRSYLLNAGYLDWKEINPDIFGSMIQAITEESERGNLGMHYTSVPNILKVLNPLFLDDLRHELERAGDNGRMLLNLRKRLAHIRVLDPACGSGNFLVIAYKQLREIEAEINRRRQENDRKSDIPVTNFRGIEIRDFPCEIARLALIIAEYQCDELYRGQKLALADFLPLKKENWIIWGNALQLDWLTVCPPLGNTVRMVANDLFQSPLDQTEIDFDNEGGETYICGNPPYLGSKWQSAEQKQELKKLLDYRFNDWKSLDYVAGWFMKAVDYGKNALVTVAFVSTNSICQGQQVPILWPVIFDAGFHIQFAHTSFKWANLANHNAGVTVVIVAISNHSTQPRVTFSIGENNKTIQKQAGNINAYLISGKNVIVVPEIKPVSQLPKMYRGSSPTDGGNLIFKKSERNMFDDLGESYNKYIKKFVGSREIINGSSRLCIWIEDNDLENALKFASISKRIEKVKFFRNQSKKSTTIKAAAWAHRFDERKPLSENNMICVPVISSENREYLPASLIEPKTVVSNKAFIIETNNLWVFAIIVSRINTIWVSTVCARMRTDFSYTNTLGWNTFPVPPLTDTMKEDLTRCAEQILLIRESYFPATIAELYDPQKMPEDLRHAHAWNDEVLERIYIGRKFRNDTERLEKLFDLYSKMIAKKNASDKISSSSRKTATTRRPRKVRAAIPQVSTELDSDSD